jgi:hypothetical protein
MAGPIAFAAVGGVVLVAVLAPSPARIDLWNHVQVDSPTLPFPVPGRTIPQTEIDAIAERPLFNATRKKDLPLLSQSSLPGLDSYRLAGVIAVGTIGVAIVERKQAKVSVTLKTGDSLDGRTVTGITPSGVTFSSAAGTETLSVPKVYGASLTPLSENKTSRVKGTTEGAKER